MATFFGSTSGMSALRISSFSVSRISTAGDHGREAGSLNNRDKESWKTRSPAGKSSTSLLNGLYLMTGIVFYPPPNCWVQLNNKTLVPLCQVIFQQFPYSSVQASRLA